MNERLSRSQMKRDELVEGLNQGVDYIQHHVRLILITAGVVMALVLGWLGWRAYQAGALERGNAALGVAQAAYDAPVDPSATPPVDPANPVFVSNQDRLSRAKELFEGVRRDHGGAPAAAASVYLGRIALEENRLDDAYRAWSEYLEYESDGMLAAAVQLDLLRIDRERGKAAEVLTQLEEILRSDRKSLPDDVVLFELAATLRALGRPEEARPYLQRILDEFPRSAYRTAAQEAVNAAQSPQSGNSRG